jgi:hypothetical protein
MPVDLDSTQIEDLVAELAGDLQILSGVACLLMMLHMTVQSCTKLYQEGKHLLDALSVTCT